MYNHIIDPAEERYCQSPEPISRERGGDLDLSVCRVRLRGMMRMVKREEMRRKKIEKLETEERVMSRGLDCLKTLEKLKISCESESGAG
jgi:hypothetical protein